MMSLVGVVTLGMYPMLVFVEVPMLLAGAVFFCSLGVTFSYVWSRSTWFGISIWLVYLSALLILFLFFTALFPNPTLEMEKKMKGSLMKFTWVSSFIMTWLLIFSEVGKSILQPKAAALLMMNLWVGQGALFMAGLGAYLFFIVVVASKLASRGGGALRGMVLI